ncbi:MAG TPA: hypothetical protein DCL88_07160 [Gammaproteobacteria bacterium]|nr:hypothetical protein [Gammaproteobacteria bacterium]
MQIGSTLDQLKVAEASLLLKPRNNAGSVFISDVTEPDLLDLMASVIADRFRCRNKKSAKLLSFCWFF